MVAFSSSPVPNYSWGFSTNKRPFSRTKQANRFCTFGGCLQEFFVCCCWRWRKGKVNLQATDRESLCVFTSWYCNIHLVTFLKEAANLAWKEARKFTKDSIFCYNCEKLWSNSMDSIRNRRKRVKKSAKCGFPPLNWILKPLNLTLTWRFYLSRICFVFDTGLAGKKHTLDY